MQMRQLINLCEKRNKIIRIGKYNFKKKRGGDMAGNQLYIVMDDAGNSLAAFSIDRISRRDENALCVHLNVDELHRRRGIGTLIYEFVEKIAADEGKELLPSPHLTKDSQSVWKKRAPDRLARTNPSISGQQF